MKDPDLKRGWRPNAIRLVLVICLLAAGMAGFKLFMSSEKKMTRRPKPRAVMAVETLILKPGYYQSRIRAMGTVEAETRITLKARVGGEVISEHPDFIQGGLLKKDTILVTLDDADYRIQVLKARSSLDKALSELALEKGSQEIARQELKLINQADLGEVTATDLALRKPQLIQARAAVETARADLSQARLNLSRTRIKVPFNAMVLEKQVHRGSLVQAQGGLATLVNVDAFRVAARIPPDTLAMFALGREGGARVRVRSQYSGQTWEGVADRLTGQVTESSRMAGVVIRVPDPLGLEPGADRPRLLLGDHVTVEITGQPLDNVFKMDRSFLRDNDTVWILKKGRLDIRPVSIAWKEDGIVYIRSGVSAGDELITSDIPAPVQGMALTASDDRSSQPKTAGPVQKGAGRKQDRKGHETSNE